MGVRLRKARWAAVGLPLILGGVDGAILIGIVAEADRCATDCLAGVVLGVASPVATPLRVAAGDIAPIVALTLGAVVLVMGFTAAWWWSITGIAQDLGGMTRRPRTTFWGCWLVAVAATVVLSAVTAAAAERFGVAWALVLEMTVWAAAVLVAPRMRTDPPTTTVT